MSACVKPKVGVLALTLEFYETLAPGLRESRETWVRQAVLPALEPETELLFRGAVFTREAIERTVADLEAAGADALLVLLLTYSPSELALPALKRTRLPIVIWNTQELLAVDKTFSMPQMIDNHGVHGTQDLANVLGRTGVPFEYVTSSVDDQAALSELADFFAAAYAVRRLRSARLGKLGHAFPGMGDFAVDTAHMAGTLGSSWVNLGLEEYIKRSESQDSDHISSLVQQYQTSYAVAADVTQADLESTARVELALRAMIQEHRLDAFTYQFLAFGDDERTPTVPFVAASRLMAEGIGFAGEGDIIGAAGVALLNWLQPPASFSEMFTIDFAGGSLFMSHMGEASTAMARKDRKIALVARPTPITRTRHRQLALVTSFQPGPATLMALTLGPEGKWRIICALARIEDYGPLPDFCVPHFKLKPESDVRAFLTNYAKAGGPHHNAVCFGDARRRLKFGACLLGADYLQL